MLIVVRTVDDSVVERLFDVYAESMGDLSVGFSSEEEMRSSYREFLEGFVSDQGHLVLVEEDGGVWRSALRAVSCGGGHWFVEAVETDPGARRRGYGSLLLRHATEYLRSLGASDVTCVIYRGNEASRRLHESCGFEATDEEPVDPWGERDECGVLYRLELRGLASLDLGDFVSFEFAGSKPIKAEDEYRSGLKVTFVPLRGA